MPGMFVYFNIKYQVKQRPSQGVFQNRTIMYYTHTKAGDEVYHKKIKIIHRVIMCHNDIRMDKMKSSLKFEQNHIKECSDLMTR